MEPDYIIEGCGCEYWRYVFENGFEDRLYLGYCDEHLPDKEGD